MSSVESKKSYSLITGASSGIGKAFALQLAKRGCNVAIVARRSEKLADLKKEIKSTHGVDVIAITADLSRPADVNKIASRLKGVRVDMLVNNAGLAHATSFVGSTWGEQQELLNVMLNSLTHLCHLFSKDMVARKHGRIINVASMAAYTPEIPGNLYNAIKAYVVHMSEALDLELKANGVRCMTLCPGLTTSDFHETMGIKEQLAIVPGWRWMTPEKVVSEALNAMDGGKHIHINGRLNKILVSTFKALPFKARYFMGEKGLIL